MKAFIGLALCGSLVATTRAQEFTPTQLTGATEDPNEAAFAEPSVTPAPPPPVQPPSPPALAGTPVSTTAGATDATPVTATDAAARPTFSGDERPVAAGAETVSRNTANATVTEVPEFKPARIERPVFTPLGNLQFTCGCANDDWDFEPEGWRSLRGKSDTWLKGGGAANNPRGWTNAVWAWGQFIDHDLVATVDHEEGEKFKIDMDNGNGESAIMTLARLSVDEAASDTCRIPITVNTPQIDAGTVYGHNEQFLKNTLREPVGCRLRTSTGGLLPVTTDKFNGLNRFVAGDARVDEHGILTAMHTVWMREHNRLCDEMNAREDFDSFSFDDKFDRARHVVAAKMQQITVKEFLPLLGLSEGAVRNYRSDSSSAAVSIEWMIAYRFGHDLIPDNVGAFSIQELFRSETFYGIASNGGAEDPAAANARLTQLMETVAGTSCAALDGKFSDALRNTLFGKFGEDLSTRNMFRSKELGMQTYSDLAQCYGVWAVPRVRGMARWIWRDIPYLAIAKENPYTWWGDFGPVNRAILTDQFHRSIFGPNGLWWENNPKDVAGFEREILQTTLGEVMSLNLPADFPRNVFRR